MYGEARVCREWRDSKDEEQRRLIRPSRILSASHREAGSVLGIDDAVQEEVRRSGVSSRKQEAEKRLIHAFRLEVPWSPTTLSKHQDTTRDSN